MADPRLLEAYLRMSPEEAKRRQSEQLRDWFEKQQEIRQSKLGESLGLGDLALLAKPATTAGAFGADVLNKLLSVPANEEYMQGVVPRGVKAARKGAVAARPANSTPRRDLIPSQLYDKYGPSKLGKNYLETAERDYFDYGIPKPQYEFLVGGKPKAGVRLEPIKNKLKVDVAERPDLDDPFGTYRALRHDRDRRVSEYDQAMEEWMSSPWETRGSFPQLPDLTQIPRPESARAQFSPSSMKALSRGVAARYPGTETVEGLRVSGAREKLDAKNKYATAPLPRLSETAAQKERSQLSKFLHEILNERAGNSKTKTASR